MTTATIADRVAAGAAYLDRHDATGPEWAREINLEQLDLQSDCGCVLGQLYTDFSGAIEGLGIGIYAAATLGFLAAAEIAETDASVDAEYTALTAAWRELIVARRGGAS